MPDVPSRVAQRTAHRLCTAISDRPFQVPGHTPPINVTISIGLTTETAEGRIHTDTSFLSASPQVLLGRADQALFGAKAHGRNQVELRRPAA
jgi:two-component system cell cycle response regulator